MKDGPVVFVLLVVASLMVGGIYVGGYFHGVKSEREHWERIAAARGVAEWVVSEDGRTEWRWKDNVTEAVK